MATEGTAGPEIIIEKWDVGSQYPENVDAGHTNAEINTYEGAEAIIKKKMEGKRLKEGIENDWDLLKYASLHREASNSNWKFVRQYIKMNPESRFAPISDAFETLMHVLASTKEPEAVRLLGELVELADDHTSLEQTDLSGMTSLHYAAAFGNVEAAKILLSKNRELLNIKDDFGFVPLHYAAQRGQKETVLLLLQSRRPTSEEGPMDIDLLDHLITANPFGIALHLMKNYSQLSVDVNALPIAFNTLATKALAFRSGSQLGFWQELVYKCTVLWKIYVVIWKVIKQLAPGVHKIDEQKQKHNQAYLLLKHLREQFERSAHSYEDAIRILKRPMHKAATMGIHELVNEVLEIYRNVLQLAVLHRREKVFVGIMERPNQTRISLLMDKSGNNVLHYAGNLEPSAHIPGAALQMQKEMQWFKALEDLVHPTLLEAQNNEKKTPWEVFTEEHKELVKQGEEWMKCTATSCTVVAALITTVVFAAAFTVPGGIDENRGTPIFLDHSSLLTFLVADTLALISSSTSILMFPGILTSRYSPIDFMEALPKELMFDLMALFFSIASMITAFGAAIHIVLFRRFKWVDIPFSLIACFPVILFGWLQFPLLIEIYMSTYHSKISHLKRA